jgi:leader peptidase (prepilin peptidase)/N-methyltransferase
MPMISPWEPGGSLLLGYLAVVSAPLAKADVRWLRLPNALVVPGLVLLLGAVVCSGRSQALGGLLAAAGPPVLAGAVLGCGWVLGAIGMGDVKLGVLLVGAATVADARILPAALVSTAALAVAAALGSRRGVAAASPGARGKATTRLPLGPPMLAGFWFGVVAAFLDVL